MWTQRITCVPRNVYEMPCQKSATEETMAGAGVAWAGGRHRAHFRIGGWPLQDRTMLGGAQGECQQRGERSTYCHALCHWSLPCCSALLSRTWWCCCWLHPQNGYTALFAAAANGHKRVVKYLLKHRADVNARDRVRTVSVGILRCVGVR